MAFKFKKIIGGLLTILLILMLILTCVFFFWLGPTVRMIAQNIGGKALGAPITIKELIINPRHGTLHMTGFVIANHNEFGRTNAVSLASMDIALDVGSIFSPTVVVHRVQIESPHFVYELNEASDNITRFIKSIEEYVGPADPDKKPDKEEKTDSEPKAVIVEQLEINDIVFHLANTDAAHLDIDVGIEQLSVSMTNGTVQLKNFHVSNPARLELPNLITLDSIEIDVDPNTVYSETVSVRDIQIVRPYAYLEQNLQTDTVTEFMDIAMRLAASQTNSIEKANLEQQPETGAEEPMTPAPPIELHNLFVDDIQIKLLDLNSTNAPTEPHTLAGIGSISVKLEDGNIQIKSIRVPNPSGYQATNLFHLAGIEVNLDPATIFAGQVDIMNILIDTPEIHLEQTESSGNVTDLQASLMGFAPPEGAVEGAPTPEAVPHSGERPEPIPLDEQPVVLHELLVTNFAITLRLPAATNDTATLGGSLKNLNPMDKIRMDKLNPLAKRDDMSETNITRRADSPLDLVFFDQLQIQPLEGKLAISNLSVANTHRFTGEHLVTIEQFNIHMDPDTLQSNVMIIEEILINKPHVTYERKIATDNIKDLQETLEQAFAQRSEDKQIEPVEKETTDGEPEKKVIINHLLVQDGLVRAKLSALPTAPIPLPDIELKDLGKDEGGASIDQALSNIGSTLYDSILRAISGTTGFAIDALKGAGALTLGTLEKATGMESRKSNSETQSEKNVSNEIADDEESEAPPRNRKRPHWHRRPGRLF